MLKYPSVPPVTRILYTSISTQIIPWCRWYWIMDKTTNFSIIINIQNVNFKIVSWRADYLKFHSFQRTIRNMNYSYRNVFGSFFCFLFRKELFLQDSVLNNCEFFPKYTFWWEFVKEIFQKLFKKHWPCKRAEGRKAGFALIVRLIVGHSGLVNLKIL